MIGMTTYTKLFIDTILFTSTNSLIDRKSERFSKPLYQKNVYFEASMSCEIGIFICIVLTFVYN